MTQLAKLPVGAARRVVFLGTPEVAVAPLRALHAAGVEIPLVVTAADKRRGRGSALSASPVKLAAQELGLAVTDELGESILHGADLGVVVAYGHILPVGLLKIIPMINVHFSLLPRWRGAAPVERALLAGDSETGICIMRVEEGLDTGEVFDRVVVPIRPDHTLSSLRSELVEASLGPLVRAVTQGCGQGQPQTGEATRAAKIKPSELQIQFTMTAKQIVALTRLETAWFSYRSADGEETRVRLLAASAEATSGLPGSVLTRDREGVVVACGDVAVRFITVQPAGKSPMSASAWANGARLPSSLA